MAVSVRMEPLLEKELELAAKRRGISKSQFIIEAVQRALGRPGPFTLLQQLKVEEQVKYYGAEATPAAEEVAKRFDGYEQPYDSDTAREFIKRKLKSKHGL